MNNTGALLLLAGAGVFILLSSRRKRVGVSKADAPEPAGKPNVNAGVNTHIEHLEDLDIGDIDISAGNPMDPVRLSRYSEILKRNMDPYGRAQLGMLYQIRAGDTPIGVCCEALYGTRECTDAQRRNAAELLIRMYCGPWNQALYSDDIENIKDYPEEIDDRISKGISFEPIYQDNRKRIDEGLRPTAGIGFKFALVWIPMIDEDILENDGIVTTRGMYHSDTEKNMGGNMIDPPQEILNIGFEYVTNNKVGCNLPDGDFRKILVAS